MLYEGRAAWKPDWASCAAAATRKPETKAISRPKVTLPDDRFGARAASTASTAPPKTMPTKIGPADIDGWDTNR